MNPVGGWLLISWLLKKMFDHKDRHLSEEEYNRLLAESDRRNEQKSLPGPK